MTTATALLSDSSVRPIASGVERASQSAALSTGDIIRFKLIEPGTFIWQAHPDLPPWMMDVARELEELLELPAGWDSYQAEPISPENLESGFQALMSVTETGTPKPHVVPTVRGSVQFEWHIPTVDLEIEVMAPFRFQVSFEQLSSGQVEEVEVTSDYSALIDWVHALA